MSKKKRKAKRQTEKALKRAARRVERMEHTRRVIAAYVPDEPPCIPDHFPVKWES